MDAYAYKAALYCAECGEEIRRAICDSPEWLHIVSEDSEQYPQGPYPHGGGEADCPQHCDRCGVFLENPLTGDGDAYVREQCQPYEYPDTDGDVAPWHVVADRAEADDKPALAEWIRFYFAPGM